VKAVGYVRISKADRGKTEEEQRLSLRTQEAAVRRYCEERGWQLAHVYEDFDATGSNENRPGYRDVLDALDAGAADRLVVVRLDRLSREADVLLGLLKPERHAWSVVATEQAIDTSSASGWLAAAMFAVIAEHERLQLSERTCAALAQRKREGKHNGRRSRVPAEVEERIARLHRDSSMSATAIAALLEDEGVPRPTAKAKRWTYEHVLAAVRRVEVRELL
jgi:DNA invertase Pin-like site-specific DNA recombinase